MSCPVCLEEKPASVLTTLACGHPLCDTCLAGIHNSWVEGALRACPHPVFPRPAPHRTPFAAGFFLPFVLGDGGRTLEESSSTYALRMKYIYPKRKADDA